MKARFFIGGKEVKEPNNYQELAIQLNFDKDAPTAQVSINEWELGTGSRIDDIDGASIANDYIERGALSQGYGLGVFEGLPFKIKVGSDTVFDGYLDLSSALIDCDKVTAPAIETGRIDWLNDIADSFTFTDLAEGLANGQAGKIKSSDYTLIPYVISEIPNYKDSAIVVLSIFTITNEIKDSIQSLLDYAAALPDILQFGNVLSIIVRVAYIVILLITAVTFIIRLFNLMIQPVKYHAGMNVKLLCERACEYLGLTFSSSILNGTYKNLVLLPEKNKQNINDEDKDGILGYLTQNKNLQRGYYKGTFGDLLRELKLLFNAKIIIEGTVLKLEREDKTFNSSNLYQIPPVDVTSYRLNREDFNSKYTIQFATDQNDKNTKNEYQGTQLQVLQAPVAIGNKGNLIGGNNVVIQSQFALGKRKSDFTNPEKVFKTFFGVLDKILGALIKAVNAIIRVVNKIIRITNKIIKALKTIGIKINAELKELKPIKVPKLQDLIENRIGLLKMENDFVTVPKLLILKDNNDARNNVLLSSNQTILNAEWLWDRYHFINSFVKSDFVLSSDRETNQYKRYSIPDVPFTCEDYQKVKTSNKIVPANGQGTGVIESLEWNPITQRASINYRVNEIYTRNLKTVKILPDGK